MRQRHARRPAAPRIAAGVAALVALAFLLSAAVGDCRAAEVAPSPTVAKPIVILKMDDLTQRGADRTKGEAVSSRFVTFVDTLRRLGVKASLGIIGVSLADGSPEYYAWIKALHEEGIVEFWDHGYTHQEGPRENNRRRAEFAGASLEAQTESLAKTQRLAKEKLGFELKVLGTPFNLIDGTTEKALDAFPEVTSWFYGPERPKSTRRRILERRMDLESPVLQPDSAQLIAAYNEFGKDLQYIVLQGHPNSWGGKQLAEFTKAVEFLKAQGCTFMTPTEFLQVELRAATLPPVPTAAKPVAAAGKPAAKGKPAAAPAAASTAPTTPMPVPEPVVKAQLLQNPTLLDADGNGLPDGWFRSTRQAGTVQKCTDDAGRFLRIGVNTPGESIIFQQLAALPADGEPITVAAKVRWKDIVRGEKGYMSGCVQMMFADDAGKKLGDYLPVASFKGASEGWQTVGQTFARPEGATMFRVQLALYSVQAGSLDIAWATAASGSTPACPAPEELAGQNVPTVTPDETLADPHALPPGTGPEFGGVRGVSLLGDNPLAFLQPFRNLDKFDVVPFAVADQPFTNAVRITVRERVPAVWDMQLRAKCPVRLKKGDVLLLTYWMRGVKIDSEFAETSCLNALQLDREPWTKVFELRPKAMVGEGWIPLQRVYTSPQDFAAGEYAFNFQFGLDPQTFELGGLSLYGYGSGVDPASLPHTETRLYVGHEPEAPWRAEAQARIEKLRKADFDITVVDAAGRPVPNAEVKVEMTRHAFGWGSALYTWSFAGDSAESRTYREKFLELFNLMVPENGLKWSAWEDERGRRETLRMIDWARTNGCEVRGHTLVWPSFRHAPERVAALRGDPAQLQAEIRKHITDIVLATKGSIRAWDAMNEPTTNFEFMQLMGEQAPAEWFKLAHELDPQTPLFLNENQILAGTKLGSLESYLDKLLRYGAPLGGIGIQGHLSVGTAAPQRILEVFDRLARYNVPLSITELDVLSDDPALQAMYLRDVLTAAFSHPALDSVTFWGFWDGRHWKGNCPLYRKDWTAKPGLDVYRQLVLRDWWTREKVRTDADGHVRVRGFLGRYTIGVTTPGGEQSQSTDLPREGRTLRLVRPD